MRRFNMEQQDVIREIYKQHYFGSVRDGNCVQLKSGFLEAVADRFGWTEQQAYIASEFLFRPANNN